MKFKPSLDLSCPGDSGFSPLKHALFTVVFLLTPMLLSCSPKGLKTSSDAIPVASKAKTTQMQADEIAQWSRTNEGSVSPTLAEGIYLRNWGIDPLVADPIALDIDDQGRVFYSRTNRQKNSEYDIRAHRDWESASVKLTTVEEKRAFLHETLSPEKSQQNLWLADLNGDGSHDWRDMKVEKEHVYRLEDTDKDGRADTSTLIVEDFNDETTDVAGALLSDGDQLFVGVGPDMWRLRDSNNDQIMDEKLSLAHGFGIHVGYSGHGMSGAEMGPDGRIYWGIGDIGFHGTDRDGKVWDYPHEGVIARANPDGSDFEIFAHGLRNTHEFAFDEYANLISVDNDGDHNGENERLVYLTQGSDSGWRITWQLGKYRDPKNNNYKVWMDEDLHLPWFEGQAAHITPAIANFISGPTGMSYNPGTALDSSWKNTFFVAEFIGSPARAAIHAFRLKPKGASFDLSHREEVMRGILATGMDFAPDGSLYFADWIDGWGTKDTGRIWQLDSSKGENWEARRNTAEILPQDFSKKSPQALAALLENPDMRIRQKAQFALVKNGKKSLGLFANTLATSNVQLARVHAIWGISQLARIEAKSAQTLLAYLHDKDDEIRAQTAKWLGDLRYEKAAKQLIPLLSDPYPRARFFAAEALGRMAYAPAQDAILKMLAVNNDEDKYLRHAGSLALSKIAEANTLMDLADHDSPALRQAAVIALRRMQHPGVAAFLKDKNEYIVNDAARAINDDDSIEAAIPHLANLLLSTPFNNEALVRRMINANLRWGSEAAMENIIAYIQNDGAPPRMRQEAIATLGTWASPSEFDRVDGRHRGKVERPLAAIQEKVGDILQKLSRHPEALLRSASANAIGNLHIKSAAPMLLNMLREDVDANTRMTTLKALATLNYEEMADVVAIALGDSDKEVRATGLALLTEAKLQIDFVVEKLNKVIAGGTLIEKQSALATLANLPLENTRKSFTRQLSQLKAGKLDEGIVLDLIEAVESAQDSTLLALLEQSISTLATTPLEKKYLGTQHGGDAKKGENITFWHQSAQCIKCHTFHDSGGTAGPRLSNIGTALNTRELLQALVAPSARVAPGYGYISLQLNDGKSISGILVEETQTTYQIQVGDKKPVEISKQNVASANPAPSSMPNMSYYLNKREIRDVISFLSTLKN